ncbi:hypothetical protein [Cupriavidus sp. YR651]|uniref:hypothetical protein n=1 Tax=Cupriavidus sp. YR651 TaxID=1855315 RepID=UPI00115FD107|nr:hypothetical protein [Cupriavidus sp. YR651]
MSEETAWRVARGRSLEPPKASFKRSENALTDRRGAGRARASSTQSEHVNFVTPIWKKPIARPAKNNRIKPQIAHVDCFRMTYDM